MRMAAALAAGEAPAISTEWLGYCLGQFQRDARDCVFVDESLTSHAAVWNHVDADERGARVGVPVRRALAQQKWQEEQPY